MQPRPTIPAKHMNPIVGKCTVKNPPKNRGQTTFEGQKEGKNRLKNGAQNST
jgi:hypothetical protein